MYTKRQIGGDAGEVGRFNCARASPGHDDRKSEPTQTGTQALVPENGRLSRCFEIDNEWFTELKLELTCSAFLLGISAHLSDSRGGSNLIGNERGTENRRKRG